MENTQTTTGKNISSWQVIFASMVFIGLTLYFVSYSFISHSLLPLLLFIPLLIPIYVFFILWPLLFSWLIGNMVSRNFSTISKEAIIYTEVFSFILAVVVMYLTAHDAFFLQLF